MSICSSPGRGRIISEDNQIVLVGRRYLQISMHMLDPKIGEMSWLEQVVKGTKSKFAKRGVKTRERMRGFRFLGVFGRGKPSPDVAG